MKPTADLHNFIDAPGQQRHHTMGSNQRGTSQRRRLFGEASFPLAPRHGLESEPSIRWPLSGDNGDGKDRRSSPQDALLKPRLTSIQTPNEEAISMSYFARQEAVHSMGLYPEATRALCFALIEQLLLEGKSLIRESTAIAREEAEVRVSLSVPAAKALCLALLERMKGTSYAENLCKEFEEQQQAIRRLIWSGELRKASASLSSPQDNDSAPVQSRHESTFKEYTRLQPDPNVELIRPRSSTSAPDDQRPPSKFGSSPRSATKLAPKGRRVVSESNSAPRFEVS